MSNIFRCYIYLTDNVILNEVKNLSVSASIEGTCSLRDVSPRLNMTNKLLTTLYLLDKTLPFSFNFSLYDKATYTQHS